MVFDGFSTFLKNYCTNFSCREENWLSCFFLILQKRKAESVSLATQVTAATPVPSLPASAEASQAALYTAIRDASFNIKSREEHEPLTSLTTVSIFSPVYFWTMLNTDPSLNETL